MDSLVDCWKLEGNYRDHWGASAAHFPVPGAVAEAGGLDELWR